ncbi:MAG: hypothetical protein II998_04090 [Clostridia bacterium]|nr:hypothetical protein [Clostridia bacterium]
MYKLYPVTETDNKCNDYIVKINGEAVALDSARVSKVPFNRRWPGHQRSLDQSELINFLSLATDEELHFEITPQKSFEKVEIRPHSLGINPEIKDGTICFTLKKPAFFTVEPFGRESALHIFADTVSNYDIDTNSDDVIYFGKGEHDAGFITLKSNQTLFIDEGAVVYGCVRANDAENIKIVGRGILDNSRNEGTILFECSAENNDTAVKNVKRPHTVQIEYCTNVEIDGITIRDSLVYNIRPIGCKNLRISNVKIIGCWRYNSDGIDMHNCEDVLIENCFIRSFDDSICVKGFDCYYEGDVEEAVKKAMYRNGKSYDVFKNVLVRNCVIWNDWGKCLEIGAETRAEEMSSIVFEDCDIIHATSTVLDCCNVDYADVFDVIYRNINVEYDDLLMCPALQKSDADKYTDLTADYTPNLGEVTTTYHFEYSAGGSRRGKCHDIKFENIHLYGNKEPHFHFKGYDENHKTKNIEIKNVFWNDKLLTEIKEEHFIMEEYTENIIYKADNDSYAQLKKNTVDGKNQLSESSVVRFINQSGSGIKVMFVGNSITLHSPRPEIGWNFEHGMAASKPENDYVHILANKINEVVPDSRFCICQVSKWEVEFKNGEATYHLYENARNFDADIIVVRSVENCPIADFDHALFKNRFASLMDFLNKSKKAKFIFTTGFMNHPGNKVIKEYAKEIGYPCAVLNDLGERDDMKAIGLFEHSGVANHPGDLGMKTIAERIFDKLKTLL